MNDINEFVLSLNYLVDGIIQLEKYGICNKSTKSLVKGIGYFFNLSLRHKRDDITFEDLFVELNVEKFLNEYATKPVSEWFWMWKEQDLNDFKECNIYYQLPELAVFLNDRNIYLNQDIIECFSGDDKLVEAEILQGIIYKKMMDCSSSAYVYTSIRLFLVEHPITNDDEIRKFKIKLNNNPLINEFLSHVYYRNTLSNLKCPKCNSSMNIFGNKLVCEHNDCSITVGFELDKDKEYYILQREALRFIYLPEYFLLDVKKICEENHLDFEMWPNKDKYDMMITYKNGNKWAIDGKCIKDPNFLINKIKENNGFKSGDFTKGFYVIPNSYSSVYEKLINYNLKALNCKNIKCVTLKKLINLVKKESKKNETRK